MVVHASNTSLILALRRQKQANFSEFEDRVVYIESSRPFRATQLDCTSKYIHTHTYIYVCSYTFTLNTQSWWVNEMVHNLTTLHSNNRCYSILETPWEVTDASHEGVNCCNTNKMTGTFPGNVPLGGSIVPVHRRQTEKTPPIILLPPLNLRFVQQGMRLYGTSHLLLAMDKHRNRPCEAGLCLLSHLAATEKVPPCCTQCMREHQKDDWPFSHVVSFIPFKP